MAEHLANEAQMEGHELPIEWYVPEGLQTVYANHLIVQHTEHEFVISFFSLVPPLLAGSEEERRAQLDSLVSVRAVCVGRVAVSPSRYPAFVQALRDNLSRFLDEQEEAE
ncbi:MAG: DUF3467 domain-containing protein [Anaerolineae bacterium]|jgi:hypothetical protein